MSPSQAVSRIGVVFGLPHAETHTVVLPHAVAYNAASAPVAIGRVARALGADHAARPCSILPLRMEPLPASRDRHVGVRFGRSPPTLRSNSLYWNPRPVERNAIWNSWTTPITDAALLEGEEE